MAITTFATGTVVNSTFLNKVDLTTEAITGVAAGTWEGQYSAAAAAITTSGSWGTAGNSSLTPLTHYLQTYPDVTQYDAFSGIMEVPSGSTTHQFNAIAGYVQNKNAAVAGGRNGVALFGHATAEVTDADVWGINTLLQDSATRAVGSLTGVGLYNELDFNVMCPGTSVIGISLGGNSLSTPTSSIAINVAALGTSIPWGTGFQTFAGACTYAFVVGKTQEAAAANIASQMMLFQFYDSTSTARNHVVKANTSGAIEFYNLGTQVACPVWMREGSVAVGNDVMATTATTGFLYVPTCAGAPTGVPATITGHAAHIIDTTNGRAYWYYGAAWHYEDLT